MIEPAFEDDELPDSWSNDDLAQRVRRGQPEDDALVLRVLAARIAVAGADNTNPLTTLKDLGNAVASIASAGHAIVTDRFNQAGDMLGDEESAEFQATIEHLSVAGRGLRDLSGWF